MKRKKELIVLLSSLLVVVLSVSVAYFTIKILGTEKDITVTAADLKVTFTSGSGTINGTSIEPGWNSGENTFTVKNESNGTYKYNIIIKDLVNTFTTNGFLVYKITSADGGYNMTDFVDVPKSSTATDTVLAENISIEKGKTHTYKIIINYNNSEEVDQSADMGKTLSGKIFITKGTERPTLANQLLNDNPTISTRTDFSTAFTTNTANTLYKATENATDVYYFAGQDTESTPINNWVKFGKYQSDKVVYRGYYSASDSDYKDYSTMDACTSATSYNINCTEHIYWNKGNDIYWRIIRTNADGSVRLLYSGNSFDTTGGYIGESAFNSINKDSMYVGYMYGTSGSLDNNRTNENNSTIKTYVDNWYSNNLTSYSKYISTEAVYCNDREVGSGTYSANGSQFNYASSTRVATNKTPTYNCTNIKDAFSGSNIQAKLTYPIGLMTADEVAYAGGKAYTNLTSPYAWYYLNSTGGSITGGTGSAWWSLSPFEWYKSEYGTFGWTVNYYPGRLAHAEDDSSYGVRPAISLKTCTLWKSGNGSPENPYEIEETESGC